MVTSTVNFGADASVNATTLSNPATPAQQPIRNPS